MLLAQATLDIPWKFFPPWLFGAIGFLAVLWLVFGVINAGKKLFGRRPPFDEELKSIVKHVEAEIKAASKRAAAELAREKNSVLKEVRSKLEPLIDRVEKSETHIEEIQMELARKWQKVSDDIHQIAIDVAVLKSESKNKSS
jgi:vacuolar-type H+-ATPase subunit E/Vma4